MKARFPKQLLSGLSFLLFASSAVAGVVNGGGGKGVECDGRLQILDFYETEIRGQPLLPAEPDYTSNLMKYGLILVEHMRTNKLPMSGEQVVQFAKDNIASRVRQIDPAESLPMTEDVTLPPIRRGCSVVQIAIWAQDDYIYVDTNLWNRLDSQNQAALMLHEYLYSQAREYGWQTSDQSRLVIGDVFTNPRVDGKMTPVWKAPEYLDCRSDRSEHTGEESYFLAIDETHEGKKGVGFYFSIIKGQVRQTRTYGFVPNIKLSDFQRKNLKPLTVFVENETLRERLFVDLSKRGEALQIVGYKRGSVKPEPATAVCKMLK